LGGSVTVEGTVGVGAVFTILGADDLGPTELEDLGDCARRRTTLVVGMPRWRANCTKSLPTVEPAALCRSHSPGWATQLGDAHHRRTAARRRHRALD
jgi:hypothetical protein